MKKILNIFNNVTGFRPQLGSKEYWNLIIRLGTQKRKGLHHTGHTTGPGAYEGDHKVI